MKKSTNTIYTKWIKQKLLDPETDHHEICKKLFGAFLVVLSAAILFTDKVTTFGLTETFNYRSVETFIWMVCQSLSPVILCVGALFKPFRFFYFIPIYIYFIQIYWVFDYEMKVDDPILHLYAIGFCVGLFLFFASAIYIIKSVTRKNQILIRNIKKSVSHISVFISNKYIKKLPEEDQKKYTVDTVKYIDSLD